MSAVTTRSWGRRLATALAGTGLAAGLLAGLQAPAQAADEPCDLSSCSGGGSGGSGGSSGTQSSGTTSASYNSGTTSCRVYANGAGMGSYCIRPGGSAVKTLRERFGNQKLQLCRYRPIPPGIPTPYNSRAEDGRYMMMTCLSGIDFDTAYGGGDKSMDVSIVFVPWGTDIEDRDNDITRFVWGTFEKSEQLPTPIMDNKPSAIPLVGAPSFFTFRWIDGGRDNEVVQEGPYANKPNGGPYKQTDREGGVVLRAEATRIRIDPNQKGIAPITCRPDTPYREGAAAGDQPEGACRIVFPRSSASARKLSTVPIPSNVDEAFWVSIEVEWRITYGDGGGDMRELGDGFTMRLRQALPVQEIQAPNEPPTVIY
ncbi:MAG: hypothetical protein PGN07_02070 [Aeromicrobium erythreum]